MRISLPAAIICQCRTFVAGLGMALAVSIAGCAWYAADADREVHAVLEKYSARALGDRNHSVRQPLALPEEPGDIGQSTATEPASASNPAVAGSRPASSTVGSDAQRAVSSQPIEAPGAKPIRLDEALKLAFTSSRDFQDQKEGLYLSGLGYTLTRYQFGPILDNTISYVYNFRENQPYGDSLGADLGVSQVLPLGGTVGVTGRVGGSRSNNPAAPLDQQDFNYDSSLVLNLRQPLLRGAGYEASHEALTQGQRELLYSIRAFELFREDFSIRVANAYYQLVSQRRQLDNDEQNYRDAIYDRQKAQALRQVDRYKDDDVFLARRREIEAEDALLQSRTRYNAAIDDFKILLGMPTTTAIRIVDDEPPFENVRLDPNSAVDVALKNRLDLHTTLDRVDDAERRTRIAGNQLLPDLNVTGSIGLDSDPTPYDEARPRRSNGSVGVELKLPLDRKSERNAYRSAQIGLNQARRELTRQQDEVTRDVLDQLRVLRQVEKRIDLQADQVKFETRAVEVTRIRYESGEASTRDLLDARRALNSAQNSLIELRVQHFIGRLRLRRTLGILFIDESGMWPS